MGRDRFPRQSLGVLHHRIKNAHVLMVGAGGIGCELLKNLVLTGFGHIDIVDLDTIDLSNLNRQFLFGHEHIKKSKALVAKQTAGKFNPNVKLEAHHGNIKDHRFNVDWFQGFDLVFNALDNIDARRHVNRMCLAADVPLIESGTTGFNGQVQVIKRGKTECYDCHEKPIPKSYPVCTIRSTPSQPIHCIVWAKSYLFTEIFGTSETESPELDHTEDAENAKEIEDLRKEAAALKKIRKAIGSEDFVSMVFKKVYNNDINRLRSMEEMWKSRRMPEPLDYSKLVESASCIAPNISHNDQKVWTLEENFAVFADSLRRLSSRLRKIQKRVQKGNPPAVLTFDKDDDDTLDFVAAAANLRSAVFGIDSKSKFDIKQMAGNIIPAIATANAMTAGLCVLQAFKVLKDDLFRARMVFLERSTARAINTDSLTAPNPNCPVCGSAQSRLIVDLERATLGDLVKDILKDELGYNDEFTINNEVGTIYDFDLDDNLSKKFSDLGINEDSFLTVIDDNDENPRINLQLSILKKNLSDEAKPVKLSVKPEIARRKSAATIDQYDGLSPNKKLVNDNCHAHNAENSVGRKRKASQAELDTPNFAKKEKLNSDGLIVLDDEDNNGTIVID